MSTDRCDEIYNLLEAQQRTRDTQRHLGRIQRLFKRTGVSLTLDQPLSELEAEQQRIDAAIATVESERKKAQS